MVGPFLVNRGKDVKTIQELLRHAKVTTTLDLYSQAIDTAKLEAQREIAVAITCSEMLTSASEFLRKETILNDGK